MDLLQLHQDDVTCDIYISKVAYAGSDRVAGIPVDAQAVSEVAKRFLPTRSFDEDSSLIWKQSVVDGDIFEFFAQIRRHRVLVVGPSHLSALPRFFRMTNCEVYEIDGENAHQDRSAILREVTKFIEKAPHHTAVLIQAGVLAPWLALKLHEATDRASIIDMGRSLDVCDPNVFAKQGWTRVFVDEIIHGFRGNVSPDYLRRLDTLKYISGSKGATRKRIPLAGAYQDPAKRLTSVLRSNFFPEDSDFLILPRERILELLARSRPGRQEASDPWVSVGLGNEYDPSKITHDIDRALKIQASGIVIYDQLGLLGTLSGACQRARVQDTTLIIVSDVNLDKERHEANDSSFELIGLGALSPWGVPGGEEFCLLVGPIGALRDVRSDAKAGGIEMDPKAVATAVVERLRTYPFWSNLYRNQFKRIKNIARQTGCDVVDAVEANDKLQNVERNPLPKPFSTLPFVPLAVHGIDTGINRQPIPDARPHLRREIEELNRRISYDNVLLVPCHPQMRNRTNSAIAAGMLESILAKHRAIPSRNEPL